MIGERDPTGGIEAKEGEREREGARDMLLISNNSMMGVIMTGQRDLVVQ